MSKKIDRFFFSYIYVLLSYIYVSFFCCGGGGGGGLLMYSTWFVYLWSGLHFLIVSIINSLLLSCFFLRRLKSGYGVHFFS